MRCESVRLSLQLTLDNQKCLSGPPRVFEVSSEDLGGYFEDLGEDFFL